MSLGWRQLWYIDCMFTSRDLTPAVLMEQKDILDSLVRRGLVDNVGDEQRDGEWVPVYRLSMTGRDLAKRRKKASGHQMTRPAL